MRLMKIRLELGRTEGFPEGDPNHGYEFFAPLTAEGHIDAAVWARDKRLCTVRHFEKGETRERGHLGRVGQGWRFEFGEHVGESDEPFFKLDRHHIVPDQYVSLVEHDGVQRPFKIISVEAAG